MLSHFKVLTYNNAYAASGINEKTTHAHLQTSVDLPDGQIDYFAGCRDDVFLPVSSIAERAKTRKRKSKVKHSQALQDVIELTDDDEFMPNQPPSKSKKKIKEKAVQDLPENDESASSARAPQLFQPTNDPTTINVRNKVQPRPSRMTSHSPQPGPISEVIWQDSASSPLDHLANNYSHSDLPPDLPLTRPLTQDRDIHPPPIEFLPPPQEYTDPPLLSSRSEENRCDQLYADPGDNMLPPATFFVGSSSLAPPVLTTPPQLQSADMVNSTSTVIEPLKDANANINTRTKNTRKPRKKQVEVGNVDFDAPQAKICEKEINQVLVEIPLPPSPVDRDQSPVLNSRKRRRKQILDDHTEDELNIGAGQSDPIVDISVHHPSPLLESNKGQPQDDPDTLGPQNLTGIPRLQKRKGKKCKSGQDIDDDAPFAPVTRRKKKLHSIEAGEQEQTFEDSTVPSKKTSKRGKKGSEEPRKDDSIQVSRMKGKRRMIITSDDESDGNVDLIVEEARVSSPDPEEYLKANEDSPFSNDSAEAADHQDDRNVLRVSHYYSYDRRY